MTIGSETGQLLSKDGLKLFYRSYLCNDPRGCVVISHGFAEHSGRYEHVAKALVKANFNVLAFDFRGHGNSEGERGYIDKLEQYLEDLNAAVLFSQKLFKLKKVFLVSHSMGGLIASLYAEKFPRFLLGSVLSAPFFAIKTPLPKWKEIASNVANSLMPKLSMPSGLDADLLSHDKEMTKQYASDPLIFHNVKMRWLGEIQKAQGMMERVSKRTNLPVLMQLAGDDRIVDSEVSRRWFELCLSKNKALIVYDDFFHEIYNEKDRKLPIGDMVSWLKSQSEKLLHKKGDNLGPGVDNSNEPKACGVGL